MSRVDAPVLLTGSIPLSGTEEVFAVVVDELGGLVAAVPDGETGYRANWVNFQAYFVHHAHHDLETLQRPADRGGVPQWSPSSFEDLWNFRVRTGVRKVEFKGGLFYAEQAARSYVTFCDLRDAGRLDGRTRFQVSLPTTPGATYAFFRADGTDYERVREGYENALACEIARILEVVPAHDLAIQWDVCNEVMDNENAYSWLSGPPGSWQRFEQVILATGAAVPEDVLMGYHLCYGDFGGRHIVEPRDLRLLTMMANSAIAGACRPVDWVHMPVPMGRGDDAYFAPLADLEAGLTRLYLGVIHRGDGVAGAARRIEAARRHAPSFGIAAECGLGRLPAEAVRSLLQLHRAVSTLL